MVEPQHDTLIRFGKKLEFGPKILSTSCWLWRGYVNNWGYGTFSVEGTRHYAHWWAWEQKHGPVPQGLMLDHLCRVKACVNPGHLEAVTNRENILRGNSSAAMNARKQQCKRGHSLDAPNTDTSRGRRECIACARGRLVARRKMRRAAGLCIDCSSSTPITGASCAECTAVRNAAGRAYYRRRHAKI